MHTRLYITERDAKQLHETHGRGPTDSISGRTQPKPSNDQFAGTSSAYLDYIGANMASSTAGLFALTFEGYLFHAPTCLNIMGIEPVKAEIERTNSKPSGAAPGAYIGSPRATRALIELVASSDGSCFVQNTFVTALTLAEAQEFLGKVSSNETGREFIHTLFV